MIVEYIRYTIPAAESAAFESDYARAARSLDASGHCQAYELTRCVDEPTCYILRIEWDSADGHMKGFRGSEVFQSFFAAIGPYLSRIAEMRHYTLTAVRSEQRP